MTINSKILFCAVMVFGQFSFTQELSQQLPAPKQALAYLKTDEGQADFVFRDGRVATLVVENGEVRRLRVGLMPVENTCQPQIQMPQCEFNLAMAQVQISLVWSKNPDKARLGQVLKFKDSESESDDFKDANLFTALMSQLNLPLDQLAHEKSYFSCKNAEWLRDHLMPDGSLFVESIGSELMLENFETGISENSTIVEMFQPKFKRVQPLMWQLESFNQVFGFIRDADPFLSTQVSHFVLKNKKDENCHVSFSTDVSEIRKNLADEKFLKMDLKTRKPLLRWNSLKSSQVLDEITNIMNPQYSGQKEIL